MRSEKYYNTKMAEKYKHNKGLTGFSQKLRKNMTAEERHLWYDFLKNLNINIYRQKVIGEYIVDFYCDKANIVVEIDGSQHYEQEGVAKDNKRDEYLRSLGITVLRYSNRDINERFENVCNDIYRYIFK